MKDNYLSTQEAAKILGISRQAVIKKIHKNQLKAERIGHIFAIPKNELGIGEGELSKQQKHILEAGVRKTVEDYGEALEKLGKE
ncbi:hypothetical protein A2V71_01560 [Candidatus Berkelbacteria bacterium RBG_13_40_8]|uniref:Helix-turn-helix domain-containing protein n=1 Tax=Candidatus Berkelbacteria bacterium RBG_13_40_8 TaxID=1797467 RepID=A0A1F5DNQ4_9BACT|nr:MAG: hypothetical protein A2V71_01560 [Candidatus Berkelbacteria bacterium RBG_13_40_8]